MIPANNDTSDSGQPTSEREELRRQAEAKLADLDERSLDELGMEDARKIMHELRVHQIELEMQNDELRLSQETLNDSRARYAELYDFAPVGYVTVSEAGMIVEANLTATKLTGVNRSDLIGLPFSRVIPPNFQDDYYKYRRTLLQTKVPQTCELMMLQKGGTDVWVRLEANTTTDAENATVIRIVMSDVTEQKAVEEELKESNAFNELLFQTIPFPMIIVDAQGHILFATPLTEKIIGKRPEAPCFCWTQLSDGGTQCAGCPLLHPPIEVGQTERVEAHCMLGGRTCDIFHTGILYRGEKAVLEVFVDITEHKEAEARRQSLLEQLVQSQKMESIGRLAGGVAHDFNNLLGVIIGRLDMVLNTSITDDTIKKDLLEAQHAAERSADLTRQLMGFARKQPMSPTPVDLNASIDGMLGILHRLIGENVNLAWAPTPNLWKVLMDPSQLDQIFANLCINARDAIDDVGQIDVKIDNVELNEAIDDLVPGEYVCISVSDNGHGMSDETLAHVFEPFYTTKSKDRGTGLGLSTIYGVVKQNKGAITVTSTRDLGTTFKIHIPRHVGDEVQQAAEPKRTPPVAGTETILLVEDSPVLLDLFEAMLAKLNYTVLVANLPEAALAIAKDHADSIQLLVTDIIMPQMNGVELANKIYVINPAIDCLLISGYTDDITGKFGLVEKGTNFLSKPFTQAALNEKIRSILDHDEPKNLS